MIHVWHEWVAKVCAALSLAQSRNMELTSKLPSNKEHWPRSDSLPCCSLLISSLNSQAHFINAILM